jgi:hypothetical protein
MNNVNSTAHPTRNRAILFLTGLTLAIGFGTAGRGDYEQAVMSQAMYCNMASAGFWPPQDGNHNCPTLAIDPVEQVAGR